MSLALLPRAGMVLIRPIAAKPAASPCGIIELADVTYEPETTGEVIAVAERFECPSCGAGRAPEIAEGDIIVFPPSAGDELEWKGERYLLVPESAILGVVVEA